ncbi:FadR/GntR family transcriptional regulator [Paenibacillus mucilaginosus]|uniref:Transcriptional regulators-like protein n=1 Tax=Paenibacillus mucilaginosus (strain KNP414) TaxID=1036673 RepID=F8FIF0_PAEMK|nr:FadR/GntR family transcriptional regulator [Paenibacillus mucilaginosus]AEI44693.1 Transcriptional regulators-like protein [Paenibacillus mucilaginosus KNP414]MCG7215621.1 FadR family transcriptional regulator [Paenibacillus mucilaginosus]WDM26245.1 FadR family transcriptional regulator [Paenibacillus mucilaginosus]
MNGTPVTPVPRRSHYEEVTEQLKAQILQGRLKAGDRLPSTKEMSERFGVSRSVTREALSALKAMGLIEIRQGGACRVIGRGGAATAQAADAPGTQGLSPAALRLDRSALAHMLEARSMLEVSNAALAAAKRTDADLERLREALADMEHAAAGGADADEADLRFHMALARAGQNPVLLRVFESIAMPLHAAIAGTRREPAAGPAVQERSSSEGISRQLLEEHTAIYEAVASCDQDRAVQQMRLHLEHMEAFLTDG